MMHFLGLLKKYDTGFLRDSDLFPIFIPDLVTPPAN